MPELIAALEAGEKYTRILAAKALGRIGPPAAEPAVPGLTALLEERDRDVQQAAADALGPLGPSAGRWCMNQFGARTGPFGGPTYSPTIAWHSVLPSLAIRFNTLHPIIASRFCDS